MTKTKTLAPDDKRVVIGLGLIGFGALALMGIGAWWPLFILLPGLAMLACAMACSAPAQQILGMPGAIVTGTGALLMVQNLTGWWASWAYAWTLYPAFVGAGMIIMNGGKANSGLGLIGSAMVRYSLWAFALGAFFFEGLLGISGGYGTLAGIVMLGLGGYILLNSAGLLPQAELSAEGKLKRKNAPKPKRDLNIGPDSDPAFSGPMVIGSRASKAEIDDWRARHPE